MAPTTWMPCITHLIYAIDFQLIFFFFACKWTACTFAGLQAFVFDLEHHRTGLPWIEWSFKELLSTVILSIHSIIICVCVSVCERQFWLCALFHWSLNNASIQQRSEAIPDTSLPLTKHQQNFSLSLCLPPPPTPSPLRSLPLTGTLHVVKFISPGERWERSKGGGGGVKRDELGRKEKNRQWPWLERWVNDQTSWQLCVRMCVYFMPNGVCVCVRVK